MKIKFTRYMFYQLRKRLRHAGSPKLTAQNNIASIGACVLLSSAIIPMQLPIAASDWRLGLLLAVPAITILLLSALAFACNSCQRIEILLLGFIGSIAAMIALRYLLANQENKWMMEGNARPIVASATIALGVAGGVVVSLCIRVLIQWRTKR